MNNTYYEGTTIKVWGSFAGNDPDKPDFGKPVDPPQVVCRLEKGNGDIVDLPATKTKDGTYATEVLLDCPTGAEEKWRYSFSDGTGKKTYKQRSFKVVPRDVPPGP